MHQRSNGYALTTAAAHCDANRHRYVVTHSDGHVCASANAKRDAYVRANPHANSALANGHPHRDANSHSHTRAW